MYILVVWGGGPTLLGIPDIKILDILSVKGITIQPRRCTPEIHKQSREDKYCSNKNSILIQQ